MCLVCLVCVGGGGEGQNKVYISHKKQKERTPRDKKQQPHTNNHTNHTPTTTATTHQPPHQHPPTTDDLPSLSHAWASSNHLSRPNTTPCCFKSLMARVITFSALSLLPWLSSSCAAVIQIFNSVGNFFLALLRTCLARLKKKKRKKVQKY